LDKTQIGKYGEDIAINYLRKNGYQIIERNFRTKFGEIDIITKYKKALIFFEVKYRKTIEYGYPYTAVNKYKLKRLQKLIDYYYQVKKPKLPPKLEVLSIYSKGDKPQIQHFKDVLLFK